MFFRNTTRGLGSWVCLIVLITLSALCTVTESAAVIDVYRMIQYDLGGEPLGSRKSTFDQHANIISASNDLSRAVVIVPFVDLDVGVISDLLSRKASVSGMLFVLPRDFGTGDYNTAPLKELEQLLIHQKVAFPVYFAMEDDDLESMVTELKDRVAAGNPPSPTTSGYRLVTKAKEARKLDSVSMENYWAWIKGQEVAPTGEKLPTIAIVAHYDTMAIAPGLAVGSDSNGSGVASLLELAHLFSLLYNDAGTQGSYNILFLLTAGAALGYSGTEHWLASVDARILETIEFALCLDSLGSWSGARGGGLHLHVSRAPKDPRIQSLHSEFTAVAAELEVPFAIVQKKIDLASPMVAWEHEHFSKKKIVAATLSSRAAPAPKLGISTLADCGPAAGNATAAALAVRLVGETLVRHTYGQSGKQISVFAEGSSRAVNVGFMEQWMRLLAEVPRAAPFHLLPPNKVSSAGAAADPASSKLLQALKAQLGQYTSDITTSPFRMDTKDPATAFTFYGETHAKLEMCKVASIVLDIWAALAIMGYLMALWFGLSVITRGVSETLAVFKPQPVRKHRSHSN